MLLIFRILKYANLFQYIYFLVSKDLEFEVGGFLISYLNSLNVYPIREIWWFCLIAMTRSLMIMNYRTWYNLEHLSK